MTYESVFIFCSCFLLLLLFVKYASSLGFSDSPNNRSTHTQTTPSSSGIVIFLAIFVGSLFTDIRFLDGYFLTIFAVVMVWLLGIIDDLKDFPAKYKLYVIAVAAVLSLGDGFVITNIGNYFGSSIPLLWLSIPFTLFAIIGFTNSFNLIDGLDGLAGVISLIIFSSFFYIGYQYQDPLLTGVSSLIIPALLAFIFFNWNPAKVFLGDSGSLTLGFVISILSIKAIEYVNPVAVLFLVSFPLIDTLVIIARRKKHGRSIFSPDRNHAHHILLSFFDGKVRVTVVVLSLIQITYTLMGLLIVRYLPQEITMPFFILNILAWYFALSWLCKKHPVISARHNYRLDNQD